MAHNPIEDPPIDLWPNEGPLDAGFPAQEPPPKPNGKHAPNGANGHTPELGVDTPAEYEAPEGSEDAFATVFVEAYSPTLRYVARWGHWYEWDGAQWREDATHRVYDRIRKIVGEEIARLKARDRENNASKHKGLASSKTFGGVEKIAKSDRAIAATTDQWDADPWALNTPGGIVNLKTGHIRPHDPLAYMIKTTAVGPSETSDCPIWDKFLDTITLGDGELKLYLQRCAGYWLTGSTQEQALFFFYGTGGNGKGVFINTIKALLKDYAVSAPADLFTAGTQSKHPTELAGLRGARMVAAQETEVGSRWAESKIKSLTGGDTIRTRFMAKDFFDYKPEFKLVIAGNHKPALRAVDPAITRRMNLIPFAASIPLEDQDQQLQEKLEAEYPAILRWMIEGCLMWQGEGLMRPEIVTGATAEYLGSEDAFGQWIAECCLLGTNYWTASKDLYASWKSWAEPQNEFVGTQRRLTTVLVDRGYSRREAGHAKVWGFDGISVRAIDPNDRDLYDRA